MIHPATRKELGKVLAQLKETEDVNEGVGAALADTIKALMLEPDTNLRAHEEVTELRKVVATLRAELAGIVRVANEFKDVFDQAVGAKKPGSPS